ncbi:cytochrome P450 [Athelia psychrophila]|uniref:Cytochrome P450 n=1 Tax=Athelia psychrophila TaxID=1759441 RepID=A0A166RGH2_9AGAM|nr:cytochrome P450 [Fibularhizoctonia sp. CBS 109695]
MAYLTQTLLCALGTFFAYSLIKVYRIVHLRWTSPLLLLPGPKSGSMFWGNLNELIKTDHNTKFHNAWFNEYGNTHHYRDLLGIPVLCTKDKRAMAHILSHSDIYQKPSELRRVLARIFGEGLLVVEGAHHKQQRKIMNPAFGATQIRALTSVFTDKALMLRDRWSSQISSDPKGTRFNYQFDALDPASPLNELNEAFKNLFNATQKVSILFLLQDYITILQLIPTAMDKQIKIAQKIMASVGAKLLTDAKVNAAADKDNTQVDKDLLTLLVKANMAVSGGQKLSDVDVLAQVPTFLVAGHETTSSATTWALFALAQLPSAQSRLRDECLDLATDSPSMDELNSLAYLDCVVKEVMRVHAPVAMTNRAAVQDDDIPLDEPWVDKQGVKHHSIRIAKGDNVSVLIACMNQSEQTWGADAAVFRPERWEAAETLAPNGIPGVWGNQLTFLAGPRSCIGYRFALAEMKALLYTLVRAFEFDLAVPAKDIISKQSIVSRPIVTSEREAGNQMPLLVRAYRG